MPSALSNFLQSSGHFKGKSYFEEHFMIVEHCLIFQVAVISLSWVAFLI